MTAAAVLVVGLALALAIWRLGDEVRRQRREAAVSQILATFAPALAAVQHDPRQLVLWYPLAQVTRTLFPEAFRALDAAGSGTFPFTKEQLKAAHARWSADWLAWERAHDAEYAVRIAQVQDDIDRSPGPASALLRTRLAAVEQEKLERYQQRYEEYVRTAKSLAALAE